MQALAVGVPAPWASARRPSSEAAKAPSPEPAPQRTSSRREIAWLIGILSVIGDSFGRGDEGEEHVLVGGLAVAVGAQVGEQRGALLGRGAAGVGGQEHVVEARGGIGAGGQDLREHAALLGAD